MTEIGQNDQINKANNLFKYLKIKKCSEEIIKYINDEENIVYISSGVNGKIYKFEYDDTKYIVKIQIIYFDTPLIQINNKRCLITQTALNDLIPSIKVPIASLEKTVCPSSKPVPIKPGLFFSINFKNASFTGAKRSSCSIL